MVGKSRVVVSVFQNNEESFDTKDYHPISCLSLWDKVHKALINAEMFTHLASRDLLLAPVSPGLAPTW